MTAVLGSFSRELRAPGTFVATAFLVVLAITAAFADFLAPYPPVAQSSELLSGPTTQHWLGTDQFGRDILSRLIAGSRTDLLVSFGSAAVAALIGVIIGLIGGTSRGIVSMVSMRSIEVILAFPPIVLALMIVSMFGQNEPTLIITMGVLFCPIFARIVYGEVLTIRNLEYVQASKIIGSGRIRMLFKVILPGVFAPILVQLSLTVAMAMLLASGLSFLGLGVPPPAPSWGGMISEGQAIMMQSPLLMFVSSAAVVLTILSFSVLSDAIERALDPRRRQRRIPPNRINQPVSA